MKEGNVNIWLFIKQTYPSIQRTCLQQAPAHSLPSFGLNNLCLLHVQPYWKQLSRVLATMPNAVARPDLLLVGRLNLAASVRPSPTATAPRYRDSLRKPMLHRHEGRGAGVLRRLLRS